VTGAAIEVDARNEPCVGPAIGAGGASHSRAMYSRRVQGRRRLITSLRPGANPAYKPALEHGPLFATLPRHPDRPIAQELFMNFPRIALGLAGLGFVMAGAAAHAQALDGTLKKIKDTGTITLGVRDASSPFSFLDDNQKAVGYSIDLCMKIVDAVKADLKMPNLNVVTQSVTSATRIPLMANGTIDLECGSTTNNTERQQTVSFVDTTFVTANRFVSKKSAGLNKLEDLKGKTLVSTSGTSNLKEVIEINGQKNLGINIVPAAEHPAAFAMVETDRASAFAMDDILLYGLVANSKNPGAYVISPEATSIQPYGIMLRKGDPQFKKVADDAIVAVFKSGEINKIYAKWFLSPIPPKGINLNVPMSDQLKKVIANPTDSGEQSAYK